MMKKEDARRRESNGFLWLDWVGGPLVKASSPHTHTDRVDHVIRGCRVTE